MTFDMTNACGDVRLASSILQTGRISQMKDCVECTKSVHLQLGLGVRCGFSNGPQISPMCFWGKLVSYGYVRL